MTDIVEKARELGEPTTTTGQLWLDLADEIERLKRENASLADMVSLLGDAVTKSKAAF